MSTTPGKGLVRPATSENNVRGWSYTQDGMGVFGASIKLAYENWQSTPTGKLAMSADGGAPHECRACGDKVHMKRVRIPVVRHQCASVASSGFGLDVPGFKCPATNCGEVYR